MYRRNFYLLPVEFLPYLTPVQTRPCWCYQSHKDATVERKYMGQKVWEKGQKIESRSQRAQRGVVHLTALAMALPLRAEEWSRESLQPRLTRVCFTDVLLICESCMEQEQMLPLSTLPENYRLHSLCSWVTCWERQVRATSTARYHWVAGLQNLFCSTDDRSAFGHWNADCVLLFNQVGGSLSNPLLSAILFMDSGWDCRVLLFLIS